MADDDRHQLDRRLAHYESRSPSYAFGGKWWLDYHYQLGGGLKALPSASHYTAANHGVSGLTNAAAIELGEYNIRVNSIHPWGVATAMAEDPNVATMLTAHPNYIGSFGMALTAVFPANVDDISDAVIYLASDLSRAVTGRQLTADMGATKV